MSYLRAPLRKCLAEYYRVSEAQSASWLRIFSGELRFAREPSGRQFRTSLASGLCQFVVEQRRIAEGRNGSSKRRAGHGLLHGKDGVQDGAQAVREFNVAWARGILAECLKRMKRDCRASHQFRAWRAFEFWVLQPMLDGVVPPPYERFAREFRLQSPTEAGKLLRLSQRLFGRSLRLVVAQYSTSERAIREEIRYLRAILQRLE